MIYSEQILSNTAAPRLGDSSDQIIDASVMARIASYASDAPDRTAIVDGSVSISFGELESQANRLAHYLLERGCGAGSTAVLFFDRSIDFVVAALGIMKSGGAYVPMDSSTPADRIGFVVADSGAQILLTHRDKARNITPSRAEIVELDGTAATQISLQPCDAPAIEHSMDSLAYVVYTSGSTGQPKGVEITHGNLNCLIEWHQGAFGLTPADRASHVAGLGFDAAGWEIWPYLAAGASVFIADETTRRSPEELGQWLLKNQLTMCFAPTVIAEQFLQTKWPKSTALRWMLAGGEALHRRPSAELPFSLANCYGPAECTVVSTWGRVAPGGNDAPSIGRAIANTTALVLDEHLCPVAAGEPGELCLGGAHVGRGYRNNPELTARHFLNFMPADGTAPFRIYRTGDRVRELPQGDFAFLGRIDDQVKIRGYRIEPGEISAWLDKAESIKKSTVIARDCGNGPELVAYLVTHPPSTPTAAALRSYLAAKLPDYMVPTRFVLLPAFPTTVNGKVDKAALPPPSLSNGLPHAADAANVANAHVAGAAAPGADSDLESRIGTIIAALLGQPSVKGTDNFFMLGGHSMLGVQLAAKLRDAFGVKLTLRQLFGAPTVNALGAEVRRLQAAAPAAQPRK